MGYIFWGTAARGEQNLYFCKSIFLFYFFKRLSYKREGRVQEGIKFGKSNRETNQGLPFVRSGVSGKNMSRILRTLFGSKRDSKELSLPVKMVDLLGEQLLTEVKPFLNMTLRSASALMFGVLQTELL